MKKKNHNYFVQDVQKSIKYLYNNSRICTQNVFH